MLAFSRGPNSVVPTSVHLWTETEPLSETPLLFLEFGRWTKPRTPVFISLKEMFVKYDKHSLPTLSTSIFLELKIALVARVEFEVYYFSVQNHFHCTRFSCHLSMVRPLVADGGN
jgi:hypothetical protein